MSDDRLIAEVAQIWVDGGGDAEGILWCADRLREAVQAEIDRRGGAVSRPRFIGELGQQEFEK